MSSINFHTKEISVKIVYYGPGLCGKTTSLHTIYASLPEHKRPQLVSLATEVDRTIFFDFLPVTAYRIKDFNVRLQLYTVPGQVFYNATRKLVLNGVDGLVFVCDSQRAMRDSNLESLRNLDENLNELGLEISQVPLVMQFNKRDLSDVYSVEEMEQIYNPNHVPAFPTVATQGTGVFDALKSISQAVVGDLMRKGLGRQLARESETTGPKTALPPAAPDGFAAVGDAVHKAAGKADAVSEKPGDRAAERPAEKPAERAADRPLDKQSDTKTAPPAPAPLSPGLWPAGDAANLGKRIDGARAEGKWNEVVLGVDDLLSREAKRWAESAGERYNAGDPLPAFLLLRNASSTRFSGLLRAVQSAKSGRSVSQAEAMNAIVLALEVLW